MKRPGQVPSLPQLLEEFLTEHLPHERGASRSTVQSYSTTFQLVVAYCCDELNLDLAALELADWSSSTVLGFLLHLEKNRGNAPRTRNQRLAAIKSFFTYVGVRVPSALVQVQQVLAIPQKRFDERLVGYLSREEMDAVLRAADRPTWSGRRDRALLTTAYYTACRVTELVNIDRRDFLLRDGLAHVRVHGKGRKERVLVLPTKVAAMLRAWEESLASGVAPLFPNRTGNRMTRSGVSLRLSAAAEFAAKECPSLQGRRVSPHVIRHTTAMHILNEGMSLAAISLFMGHESLETTHKYLEASLRLKRKTLEALPTLSPSRRWSKAQREEAFGFLDALKRSGRAAVPDLGAASREALRALAGNGLGAATSTDARRTPRPRGGGSLAARSNWAGLTLRIRDRRTNRSSPSQ
ncbi:MAG: tyrosine-type recombinase/integrase [Deltaproteobacteria bacterium]|nr:tyrosine-type recombinase/integrase [Deltaproteobacteria bacterium]